MAGINKHSPGCSCCGCSLTAHVVDCRGTAVSGASVTFVNGATTLSGTTDASGNATVTAAAGTWTVTASKTNYFGASGSITITCPTGGTINLTLKEGDPSTTTSPLYITLGGQTITLPKLFGVTSWTATTSVFGSGAIEDVGGACTLTAAPLLTITVNLTAAGCWTVGYTVAVKDKPGSPTDGVLSGAGGSLCGVPSSASLNGTVSSFTASPISITGTLPTSWTTSPPGYASIPAPPVTGSFSVSQ